MAVVFELVVSFSCQLQQNHSRGPAGTTNKLLVRTARSSLALGDVLIQYHGDHELAPENAQERLEAQRRSRKEWENVFTRVSLSSHNQLWITFNRPAVTEIVFSEVLSSRAAYGTSNGSTHNDITVLPVLVSKPGDVMSSLGRCSVQCGRVLLTGAGLAAILRAAGNSASLLTLLYSNAATTQEKQKESTSELSMDSILQSISCSTPTHDLTSKDEFLSSLLHSQYRVTSSAVADLSSSEQTTVSVGAKGRCHSDEDAAVASKSLVVDAGKFLAERNLIGRNGFSSNIRTVEVTDSRGSLTVTAQDAVPIYNQFMKKPQCMVVIATQHHEYQVQQRLVLVLMAAHHRKGTQDKDQTAGKSSPSKLKLLLTGSVKCVQCGSEESAAHCGTDRELSTMDELIQSRLSLMKAAMNFKYGDTIQGPTLDHMVSTMADAIIKFEHLSSDPGATLKLEMPSVECFDGQFDGVFVLYNYARISNILQKYQQEIQSGRYPPLPELSKVDLSLLREEEEWSLVLQYVLNFPTVVKEAAEVKGQGLRVQSVLKKLSQFLNSLCRSYSGYYSRYKVLMAPEPHLLPLVHARVYLLKVIKQILLNGLSILGIRPLDQL